MSRGKGGGGGGGGLSHQDILFFFPLLEHGWEYVPSAYCHHHCYARQNKLQSHHLLSISARACECVCVCVEGGGPGCKLPTLVLHLTRPRRRDDSNIRES